MSEKIAKTFSVSPLVSGVVVLIVLFALLVISADTVSYQI